jgi:hypothetical protein
MFLYRWHRTASWQQNQIADVLAANGGTNPCRGKVRIVLALFLASRKTRVQDEREGNTVPQLKATSGLKLEFVNQIACFDSKRLGDTQQRVQADPLLSAFDFSHINRMQIGFFRELFLTQANFFSAISDGVAQDFQLSRTRHNPLGEQDRRNLRTPNMGLFFLACIGKTA